MDWIYEDSRIYSVDDKNQLLAETTFYMTENGEICIDYTYVNPVLRGQGVAGKMMEVVSEHLRQKGLKTTATCSYAIAWFNKHKKLYSDILSARF